MTRKEERLLPEVETPVCAPEELMVVGKRIPKSDALFKVLGQAKYIYDMQLPGMLYGKILWSERAHAKIISIDTTEAEKVPGVRAVITAHNTPEIRIGFMKDQPVLKRDKVRSFRDEVAAVAATSWEAAEEAVSRSRWSTRTCPVSSLPRRLWPGRPSYPRDRCSRQRTQRQPHPVTLEAGVRRCGEGQGRGRLHRDHLTRMPGREPLLLRDVGLHRQLRCRR